MADFKQAEERWQKFWAINADATAAKDVSDKPKKYILVEFPYPSGSGLHVGHAFSFVGGDVYARFNRMRGYNVLFPMGWDAFGLPTENYAIKTKRKPQEVTKENTDMFRQQMKRLAFSFDWGRELNTTDPSYYKWTQWIFIKLFEKGLAYKKEMPINWCPSCKIGLANEEVINNKCERCGAEVERRTIAQWVVRITDYADKLIEGLEETNFIEKVKTAQINWIGKSKGAKIRFQISNNNFQSKTKSLEVFTTRPDTLYGVTFMVIAPEHELVNQIIGEGVGIDEKKREEIRSYTKASRSKSELERTELSKEKTGVFSGLFAINPVNQKEIPIWISDFVLASYGTGAIMAVPAHDDRDYAFAKKFDLPILPVIENKGHDYNLGAMTETKIGRMINSPEWNGIAPIEAMEKAGEWLKEKGIGEMTASYHLRDWIFSRQHYWGEPIPMIYCRDCAENHNFQSSIFNFQINSNDQEFVEIQNKLKEYINKKGIDVEVLKNNPGWYPVAESQLPVRLPEVEAYEPTDTGESPLANIQEFVETVCPICGKRAKRETDTMPNWAGSDWYYLRYCDPLNDIEICSQEKAKKWLPVDIYVGGDEHNTLHLLYSRFIFRFLYDIGAVPIKEPYYKRISHGVILGPDNQRMSKSKGNVIVPESIADIYGVDVTRMYLMFMGPFDGTMAWNEKTLMGVKRFLDRFNKILGEMIGEIKWSTNGFDTEDENPQIKVFINKTYQKITNDIEQFGYNTAIASLMELLNKINEWRSNPEFAINRDGVLNKVLVLKTETVKNMIKLLAPFAPYIAEDLWFTIWKRENGKEEIDSTYVSVHKQDWPVADTKYLIDDRIKVAIAINGKVRSEIEIDSDKKDNKDLVLEMAKSNVKIMPWVEGREVLKEIYVPGKMVNLVIK